MAQIILDISANTHKNDWPYLKRMLDELKAVDTGKHEIVIKHQLFLQAGDNLPLLRLMFEDAYNYAKDLGYKTTSSVFDKESLDFLLKYDIPFVKIANNRELDWLIGEMPRKMPVYVSCGDQKSLEAVTEEAQNLTPLLCVSDYPSFLENYEYRFRTGPECSKNYLQRGCHISDHTTNFGLWYRFQPEIIEWHYKLEDSTGLDAGPFARTPAMLAEVL